MDFNPEGQQIPSYKTGGSSFLIASVLCAALAFFCECSLPISMIFTALAIVFAILSKGKERAMQPIAKISVGIAVISLLLSISLTAFSFWNILTDPVQREAFNQTCQELYGVTFDETLNELEQLFQ